MKNASFQEQYFHVKKYFNQKGVKMVTNVTQKFPSIYIYNLHSCQNQTTLLVESFAVRNVGGYKLMQMVGLRDFVGKTFTNCNIF